MELPFNELSPRHLMRCDTFLDMRDTSMQDQTVTGVKLHSAIWQSGRDGDPSFYQHGLDYLAKLRTEVDVIERELVMDAREQRFTWDQIGRWLGTSRQGAYNRFGGAELRLAVES